MALILRLLRLLLPLFLFYLIGKILRSFIAVYMYQRSRGGGGSSGSGYGNPGGERSGSGGFSYDGRSTIDPYIVLGCSRSSSTDEIKKKYRELIAKYHPDRFVGMSLDDDFVKLASKKFQDIQAAYDSIRKERGF
ncbi:MULTISPECIES: J domain-containing protein [Dethiosulfovibrio]|uniref:DnaJ domain-containing protein n=2 Tax=Dethiosulfovibrio TaxID=47054 RepID=A0ABS9ELF8_9BACT|nr:MULTISPECIES: DnaJ domain-containing protein [Dethiosulfovibrio]MCF4113572.1 DnaJ domain-containing protein [Dethiosulfovibrio russensis]MCF4142042.1 DnaJ domain-containing protein [Dethiosulfovibrio marinus]MCF4144197.1 DnaJ domain-containing protein [Dethiosulfovibrio acidaminovorans]